MVKKSGNFRKEDIMLLAQLVQTMKEVSKHIEHFYSRKESEKLEDAKSELLSLQKRVDELI
jgi:hypothetical protein|tara:strand:- start:3530 stop:3712 length:183 start_codon:yes stop_codon:yes gene_type:complete